MALTVAQFDAMMKEIYPDLRIQSLAMKKRPLLQYIPKEDVFYGDTYVVPVLFEDPQGRSADLAVAITNAATTKQVKFVLTERKKDYGVIEMEAEAIMAASKDVGAFIKSKSTQIEGKLRNMGKSLHTALYRSGSGSIGVLSAITGSGLILTLTRKSDVHNFGVGQTLIANETDDDTTMLTGGVLVTKRDVGAGTITVDTDVEALGSPWSVTDFLFTEGDQDSKATGLEGWIPLTTPGGSDSFFGVNRSVDATRLAGHRVDSSGRSVFTNAQELAMLIGEEGHSPDSLFLNPRAGLALAEEVGAKVERSEGGKGIAGHTGFTIQSFVTGPVDIVFDIACPEDRGYMLSRETWLYAHMGAVPHTVKDDGRDSLRGATTDDIQMRFRYFGELTCEVPAANGVMSVATT